MTTVCGDAVQGTLLSCFTSALAEYLHQAGADWLAFLAHDPVLAVRPEGDLLAFMHHRAALRRGPLALRRTGCDDAGSARLAIECEVADHGRAVVVGDTFHLPWSTGRESRHAPHWYVVDAVRTGQWHVSDPFTAVDARGVQPSWSGWLDANPRLAMAVPALPPDGMLRERYAFGADDPEPCGVYQWFQRDSADGGNGDGARPLTGPGWYVGADALRLIAERIRAAPADPATYRHTDDLWVAARNWRAHAAWCDRDGRPGIGLASPEACALWESLPMRLRFVTESLARGLPPRPTMLTDALDTLADLDRRRPDP
jgi:hypothetical protein